MNPMRGPYRGFLLTLITLWTILTIAGVLYARFLELPWGITLPVISAFLWEASFYLVPGFAGLRQAIEERWPRPVLAGGLALSAIAPYCVYTLATGTVYWAGLALLAALAAVVCFWYLLLPGNPITDAVFLVFMAAVVLSGVFSTIYPSPAPKVPLGILGQLMWTRLGVLVILWFRKVEGVGFGFIPTRADWAIGIRNFVYFLPIGLPLAMLTGFVRWRPVPLEWWQAVPLAALTFLGMLWVVALSEEFFFRGLLQQWLCKWLGSRTAGLVAASVAFGLVHLPFRSFPNWKFALVAAVAGLFYGRAYSQSGSIRAAMVAHALMNTTTQMLFPRI